MQEFYRIAEEEGWDKSTQVRLLMDFLHEMDDAFNGTVSELLEEFALKVQKEENQ